MNYALIGSGHVAWYLADALTRAGHTCSGLWARNAQAAAVLAAAYNLPRYAALQDVLDGMDACIIAVPDAAIGAVAAQLRLPNTVLLHCAGAVPLSVLTPHAANTGVLWPLYSIRREELPLHKAFTVVYEGSTTRALHTARQLAESLSNAPLELPYEQRRWMHLAAVLGNNFINHLLMLVATICKEQRLPLPAIQPLLAQTFTRLERNGSNGLLQTGPALRGDTQTMQTHEAMLAQSPAAQALYRAISESIRELRSDELGMRGEG